MPRTDVKASTNQLHTKHRKVEKSPEHLLLTEVPPAPEGFDEAAQFWWQYTCTLLIECGTLSRLFIGSIRNLCRLMSIIETIENQIAEDGTIVPIVKKYQGEEYTEHIINPMAEKLAGLYLKYDSLANSLGLTLYSSKINATDATGASSSQKAPTPPKVALPKPSPQKT